MRPEHQVRRALRSSGGSPARVRRGAARAPALGSCRAPLARATRAGAARVERSALRVCRRVGRARLGRGPRVGRARVPRLLPLRRPPDRAAARRRLAPPLASTRGSTVVALLYAGLAIGVAIAVPLHGTFTASGFRRRKDHLHFFPARLIAVLANSLGTAAVVLVAAATFRRRPLGNALIVLGVAIAAVGSALAGLGAAETAAFAAAAVLVLYAGFVAPAR